MSVEGLVQTSSTPRWNTRTRNCDIWKIIGKNSDKFCHFCGTSKSRKRDLEIQKPMLPKHSSILKLCLGPLQVVIIWSLHRDISVTKFPFSWPHASREKQIQLLGSGDNVRFWFFGHGFLQSALPLGWPFCALFRLTADDDRQSRVVSTMLRRKRHENITTINQLITVVSILLPRASALCVEQDPSWIQRGFSLFSRYYYWYHWYKTLSLGYVPFWREHSLQLLYRYKTPHIIDKT